MSGVLHEAAQALRDASGGVEKFGSDTTSYGRAATDLDRLGFFRVSVARLVADWLEACGADLDSAAGHISSCDEPDSIQRASTMANLILKRADS